MKEPTYKTDNEWLNQQLMNQEEEGFLFQLTGPQTLVPFSAGRPIISTTVSPDEAVVMNRPAQLTIQLAPGKTLSGNASIAVSNISQVRKDDKIDHFRIDYTIIGDAIVAPAELIENIDMPAEAFTSLTSAGVGPLVRVSWQTIKQVDITPVQTTLTIPLSEDIPTKLKGRVSICNKEVTLVMELRYANIHTIGAGMEATTFRAVYLILPESA